MTAPSPEEAAAIAAERAKLGPQADARIKAVQEFIAATASPDEAKAIMSSVVTAQQVEGFERMMAGWRTAAPPVPSSPAPQPDFDGSGRVSEARWQRMSNAERLDYSRQWDQRQFENHRGRR